MRLFILIQRLIFLCQIQRHRVTLVHVTSDH